MKEVMGTKVSIASKGNGKGKIAILHKKIRMNINL